MYAIPAALGGAALLGWILWSYGCPGGKKHDGIKDENIADICMAVDYQDNLLPRSIATLRTETGDFSFHVYHYLGDSTKSETQPQTRIPSEKEREKSAHRHRIVLKNLTKNETDCIYKGLTAFTHIKIRKDDAPFNPSVEYRLTRDEINGEDVINVYDKSLLKFCDGERGPVQFQPLYEDVSIDRDGVHYQTPRRRDAFSK